MGLNLFKDLDVKNSALKLIQNKSWSQWLELRYGLLLVHACQKTGRYILDHLEFLVGLQEQSHVECIIVSLI